MYDKLTLRQVCVICVFLLVAFVVLSPDANQSVLAIDLDLDSVRRAGARVLDDVRSSLISDAAGKQNPSWIEAATSLAAAFADCPEENAAITHFVFGFSGAEDENYASALCATLSKFVRCIPPSADTASGVYQAVYATLFDKGTSRSRAWDFEIVAHLHRTVPTLRWGKLPFNVKSVRIEGPSRSNAGLIWEQRVDASTILGVIPPHVTNLVMSAVDLHWAAATATPSSTQKKRRRRTEQNGGQQEQQQQPTTAVPVSAAVDELETLELHDCGVSDSFLETGPWFSLLTKLVLHNCVFYDERQSTSSKELMGLVGNWAMPMDLLRTVSIRYSRFFPVERAPPAVDTNKKTAAAAGGSGVLIKNDEDVGASAEAGFIGFVAEIIAGKEFVSELEFVAVVMHHPGGADAVPPTTSFAAAGDDDDQHPPRSNNAGRDEQSIMRRRSAQQVSSFFTLLAQTKSLKRLVVANVPLEPAEQVGSAGNAVAAAGNKASLTALLLPSYLEVLALRNVGLTALPDLTQLPETVVDVDFSFNLLSSFPMQQIVAAPKIRRINLAGNRISGGLDTQQLPEHLLELNCSRNMLGGPLGLSTLPRRIEVFDVSHNRFSGNVGSMQHFPDSARHILFNDNKLTGRYDYSQLPLLSVRIMWENNDWDSLMPRP